MASFLPQSPPQKKEKKREKKKDGEKKALKTLNFAPKKREIKNCFLFSFLSYLKYAVRFRED